MTQFKIHAMNSTHNRILSLSNTLFLGASAFTTPSPAARVKQNTPSYRDGSPDALGYIKEYRKLFDRDMDDGPNCDHK